MLEWSRTDLEHPGQALEHLDCILDASWERPGGFGRRFKANLVGLSEFLARFDCVLRGTRLPLAPFGKVWSVKNVVQKVSKIKMGKYYVCCKNKCVVI